MKQQFRKDRTDTIRLTQYENNTALIPTSAFVTLYKPAGQTLQAEATASVDVTTGEMTYSLTTTHTATLGLNYKASWRYVIGGVTYYEDQLFDVVRSVLSIPITDEDIYSELNTLRKSNNQGKGTATSGTSSTLVDTLNRKEADNYWQGGTIEIVSGTGAGQKRDISSNVQSSGTITVTPNWTTSPSSTSKYIIVQSYASKIEQSFKKVCTMLYNKGKRDSLIIESSQIEIPLLYLTIHNICTDLMTSSEDKFAVWAREYKEKFENAFNTMTLEYDEDESGSIDEQEKQSNTGEIRLRRS